MINGTRSENDLKFRISSRGVNDVGGMSLSSLLLVVPEYYIVCLGNSNFMSRYTEAFVNFTVNFQVNDARQIPIIIPTEKELEEFEELFNLAFKIKKATTDKEISSDESEKQLFIIQEKLDTMVNELYGI